MFGKLLAPQHCWIVTFLGVGGGWLASTGPFSCLEQVPPSYENKEQRLQLLTKFIFPLAFPDLMKNLLFTQLLFPTPGSVMSSSRLKSPL